MMPPQRKTARSTIKPWKYEVGQSVRLLVWLVVIGCLTTKVGGIQDGLYDNETDFVRIIDVDTIETQVIKSRPNVIWVVEFYNSWCGHCINFAPAWKQLAKDMKEWSDLVVIAAIDCSQSKNMKTCRQFEINSYPTMKMFPPSDEPGRLDKVTIIKTQLLQSIKTKILSFMTQFAPPAWPRLKPLEKMQDLWQEKSVHSSQLFIIFEEKESEVGRQVAIDLRNVTGILVFRMLKDEVLKYGITEFPSLYRFNKDATYSKLAVSKDSPELDRVNFVYHILEEVKSNERDSLKVVPESYKQGIIGVNKPEGPSGPKLRTQMSQSNRTQVNMQDLESALHYSLRQEVAICHTLEGERLDALKSYINVLRKYFPGRSSVQLFLVEVWKIVSSLASPSLSGEEWMNKLDGLQTENQYLPEVIRWASCRGSSPQYRGFPCSMWTLFHVLTVGAHAQSRGRTPADPREVLLAIRGYMKHFFGCSDCSKHFLEMSQNVSSEVTSHAGSILWLWRRHNRVNQRLSGDESEDPKFLKVQFPPESLCPDCKSAGGGESWDEDKVLAFLLAFYSESGIFVPVDLPKFQKDAEVGKDPASLVNKDQELDWWEKKQEVRDLRQVQELRSRRRNRKRALSQGGLYVVEKAESERVDTRRKVSSMRSLWGLTELDLSMCVVFYIISTLIILLLYHHFIIRRHMNPCRTLKTKSISL